MDTRNGMITHAVGYGTETEGCKSWVRASLPHLLEQSVLSTIWEITLIFNSFLKIAFHGAQVELKLAV